VRIAFHAPRASYLRPGLSGDKVLVARLLEALRERGHEVEIVSCVNARDLWRRRAPARRLLSEAIAVRQRMRRFRPEGWLVFNPSNSNPDLFGWWQHPSRYVLINTDVGGGSRLPRRWRLPFALAHRRSLARADAIAACDPGALARLRSLGLGDRSFLIPLAGRTQGRRLRKADARRQLGLPQRSPIVLCVSRLTVGRASGRPPKTEMVVETLRALAELPSQASLVIVGDGPGRERVERTVQEFGLSDRVRLEGRTDAQPYFAACDVFAFPHPDDRPYLAVLEAQAAGLPVVAMRQKATAAIVDAGRTGLLAANLPEFRSHLAALIGDSDRREAMGQAARAYVARSHSIDVRVEQLEALLSDARK
jgi:glycosyltransferase involved in cell wall biosynthesis